jgi:plastocyanin
VPAFGYTPAEEAQIQHLHFRYGPLSVIPGQNLIRLDPIIPGMMLPAEDGYVVGIKPSLSMPDGSIPPVTQVHLHHGNLLNASHRDIVNPSLPERTFASGEEKTYAKIPDGYGYPYKTSDTYLGIDMVHNLTTAAETVYLDAFVDFIPATAPLAKQIKPVRPVWMDVEDGSSYPVFDALRKYSHNGVFLYPDDQPNAYGGGRQKNVWNVDRAGTLIFFAGHVHPGGMYDDLELQRPGATPAQARRVCRRVRRTRRARRGRSARVRTGTRRTCRRLPAPVPGRAPNSVRIFRSDAVNYDPAGRVSWDISMTRTDPNWRVSIKPGDKLRITAAYDTSKGSWYEGMGIAVGLLADEDSGVDPFHTPVKTTGPVTHGRLPENVASGGGRVTLPDPASIPTTQAPANVVNIANFLYAPGDMTASGALGGVPTIKRGQQLTFVNDDAGAQIYHTITACRNPCNRQFGNSYPLADGTSDFDSGELGVGIPYLTAAANRVTWSTPSDLPDGTYTYFCRIHPQMRGAFKVID